jgi:polyphosphate glucokinase
MQARRRSNRRYTLSIDVGGSNVKAAVLGKMGDLVTAPFKEETPKRLTPRGLLSLFEHMARQVPHYDRVAVGIPGIVHRDVIYSLPAAGRRGFKGFALGRELHQRIGVPVRVTNDATMHGLAIIRGEGVEMVITLGTGLGTALFIDGVLSAHYQTLADAGQPKGSPYGDEARRKAGRRRWERRVLKLIAQLGRVTNFDRLYVGGGNAKRLGSPLPRRVTRIDNVAGVLGGHRLWEWGDVP